MRLIILALALALVIGFSFATYCTSSGDCADDEYCDSGTCKPYFSTSSSSSGCCGPSFILLLVAGLAFFAFNEKRISG